MHFRFKPRRNPGSQSQHRSVNRTVVVSGLFHEFQETGAAAALGYSSAADLRQAYPKFFWNGVRPYIEDALGFLQVTQDGKAWIANLYGNVFAAEHGAPGLGRPG